MNGRVRAVLPGGLEQVQGAGRVDPEIGERLARRPVMRRLGGGMDDQVGSARDLAEDPCDTFGVPDVQFHFAEVLEVAAQRLADLAGRSFGAEERGSHVVLDADHLPAVAAEPADRL